MGNCSRLPDAALLAHFVNEKGVCPAMKTQKIGYGAGSKDLHTPNVLRIIKGEIDDALISDMIEMLETNVDDVTGQVLGNLIEELLKCRRKRCFDHPGNHEKRTKRSYYPGYRKT